MQVTVESTSALERRVRIELPADQIESEVDTRLKSFGRTAKIKGFRPGKVPAKVVRQRYGKQVRQEVLADMMQKSYSEAVVREKLNPAGNPRIEQEEDLSDKGFAFVAKLEVLPEVELKDLDKVKVEKPDVTIDDKDLDEMIKKLQQQKADWAEVDRKSKSGDKVIVDFSGELDGELIEGGQGKEVPIVLGEGSMLPDFEKGLDGIKAGDEKTFKVKFPKDYHAADLQGKTVNFTIQTHRVEEQNLPAVDDAFAELFGVEEGGIEKFKQDVRDNMEREAAQRVKSVIRDQITSGLLETNPIEIPQVMKHNEVYSMQQEAMRQLGIEDHSEAPPAENFADTAEKRVRLGLLVRQIIADREFTADEEMLRDHITEMVASYENPQDMVDLYMNNPQLKQQLEPVVLEQLAFDWVLENAKVKTKKVSFTDFMDS
ncbi:MAG: trigger factor [Woeseiaceae bacterium]|nr:trigger factor [Woeseiaceae bacterium]